jgi:hypothetical protein
MWMAIMNVLTCCFASLPVLDVYHVQDLNKRDKF